MRVRSRSRLVLLACAVCVGYTSAASAQAPPRAESRDPAPQVSEPMRALRFLVGKWQGKVRYEPGVDPHQEVAWTSHVRYNLGGNMLLIDERGAELANPGKITKEVLVVVYWDPAAKEYPARLYWSTKDGAGSVELNANVREGTLVLHTTRPGQRNRYTLRLNDNGQWHEVGEISRDGGENWKRTFEMTLTRRE